MRKKDSKQLKALYQQIYEAQCAAVDTILCEALLETITPTEAHAEIMKLLQQEPK